MGRAEFRPLVCRLRHPHQPVAFQAAESPQGHFLPRRAGVIIRSMPVSITAAIRTAVFLRNPIRRKFTAADRAHGLPFHRWALQPPAASRVPSTSKKARKKDSIHLCCLHTFSITGHTYPRIFLVRMTHENRVYIVPNLYPPPGMLFYIYTIRYICTVIFTVPAREHRAHLLM